MGRRLEEFRRRREELNRKILDRQNLPINRFFSLDAKCYEDGALPAKVKELAGLVASMVLRCDDCISYHLIRCAEQGWTDEELMEAFNTALVVGGSIVIPHLRRAVEFLEEIRAEESAPSA